MCSMKNRLAKIKVSKIINLRHLLPMLSQEFNITITCKVLTVQIVIKNKLELCFVVFMQIFNNCSNMIS